MEYGVHNIIRDIIVIVRGTWIEGVTKWCCHLLIELAFQEPFLKLLQCNIEIEREKREKKEDKTLK